MKYKLVMLDVDGTILSDTPEVSEGVKSAIRRAQDLGVTVSLCTGRLATTCQDIVEELQLDSYSVYYSGTLLKNLITGKTLKKHALDPDVAEEIVRFARTHRIYVEVHTEQAFLYELQDSYSDFQRDTLEINPICTDILEVVKTHEVLKLQFVTESPEELEKINSFKHNNGHIALSSGKAVGYPSMTFTNVIPAGISKGAGIQEIADFMGIGSEHVIAIGDSMGDISAIKMAGLGVAMGNSEEKVKRHADYIAASVWEDGVAEVLEKFILNNSSS